MVGNLKKRQQAPVRQHRLLDHQLLVNQTRQSFDLGSDQVHSETGVPYRGKQSLAWIFELKNAALVAQSRPALPLRGTRTLYDTAVAKCALEANSMCSQTLQSLPWSFGKSVWQEVVDRRLESFYVWREFAKVYGSDFSTKENTYLLDIKTPSMLLTDYIGGLTSPEYVWKVALRISPKEITVTDLVGISQLQNLSILDLSDGQLWIENRESTFDYRVIRTWSELAYSRQAFKHLEVLMLGWQEKVSEWIFAHLQRFPCLRLVIITDCRQLNHKNRKDWEGEAIKCGFEHLPSKRGVKILRSFLDDRSFYMGSISNFYHFTSFEALSQEDKLMLNRKKPLLECWFGKPKPWSHILDEFPGTRTICFVKRPSKSIAEENKRMNDHPTTPPRPKKTLKQRPQTGTAGRLLADLGYA